MSSGQPHEVLSVAIPLRSDDTRAVDELGMHDGLARDVAVLIGGAPRTNLIELYRLENLELGNFIDNQVSFERSQWLVPWRMLLFKKLQGRLAEVIPLVLKCCSHLFTLYCVNVEISRKVILVRDLAERVKTVYCVGASLFVSEYEVNPCVEIL